MLPYVFLDRSNFTHLDILVYYICPNMQYDQIHNTKALHYYLDPH